jgi:(E)-4-hydroxy-3-methylbut-2-enyl-diphosphate synthase
MASARQIHVGGVPIGGGAPVAVQTMTKTETANLGPTMDQIRRWPRRAPTSSASRCPREQDVEALKTIVRDSPIPVIADIHFNHTLAIKAIEAGAHCVRINPATSAAREDRRGHRGGQAPRDAAARGGQLGLAAQAPARPRVLQPVEALVSAATEWVELMHRLEFQDFKVSMKSTSVPNTIASNRLLAEKIDHPLHLGSPRRAPSGRAR